MLHVDDATRLDAYAAWLDAPAPPDVARLDERERRLLRMLVGPMLDRVAEKHTSLADGAALLWRHPQIRAELRDLCSVLRARIAHVQPALGVLPGVPLRVHARYFWGQCSLVLWDGHRSMR
jgi:hypothetical protein